MKTNNERIISLDQFKDKHFGVLGTPSRNALELGYEHFKIGAMIHEARLKKGMTQEELALKVGTTKSYISRIENGVKEARFSTLQKIVELGLGGQLEVSIKM